MCPPAAVAPAPGCLSPASLIGVHGSFPWVLAEVQPPNPWGQELCSAWATAFPAKTTGADTAEWGGLGDCPLLWFLTLHSGIQGAALGLKGRQWEQVWPHRPSNQSPSLFLVYGNIPCKMSLEGGVLTVLKKIINSLIVQIGQGHGSILEFNSREPCLPKNRA